MRTPALLLAVSGFVAVSWLLLGIAGGPEAVSVLSGTVSFASPAALLGAAYAASWLATVLVAPVLVLAAAMLSLRHWLGTTRSTRAPRGEPTP